MDDDIDLKIYRVVQKSSDLWCKFCEAEEELRELTENIPEGEKQLREILVSIKVILFNKKEDFRGYEVEKSFDSRRESKLDLETINHAIKYLKKLKNKYKKT